MSLQKLKSKVDQAKGKLALLEKQKTDAEGELKYYKSMQIRIEQAKVIIQAVATQTQEQLEYQISELVTLALGSVFDDTYDFRVKFDIARGKTEAKLYLEKDGQKYNPLDATGGGVADVVAFGLRLALWSLKPTRKLLILDEPMRFLSRDKQARAARMIRELSGKLGLQIIMVTHSPEMIEAADKVFEIEKVNGVSIVKEVGNG